MKIKKDDNVIVISGKDKGKKGKVLRTIPDEQRVVVEGIAIVKKHQKPSQKAPGGIIEKPLSISASKVKLICQNCAKPVRVTKGRLCTKCKSPMDKEK